MPNPQVFYARVKPYNKKRGQVVRRIVVLGRLWEGGSGIPPDTIPGWVKVNGAQAHILKTFRQIDNDPFSGRVFDIVTPRQRAEIDLFEENHRKAILGIGGQSITELPNVKATTVDAAGPRNPLLRPDGSRMTLEDLKGDAPIPIMPSYDDDDEPDPVGAIEDMKVNNPPIKARVEDISGRQEATMGFDAEEEFSDEIREVTETLPLPPPMPAEMVLPTVPQRRGHKPASKMPAVAPPPPAPPPPAPPAPPAPQPFLHRPQIAVVAPAQPAPAPKKAAGKKRGGRSSRAKQ